jgi:hypothetical protein
LASLLFCEVASAMVGDVVGLRNVLDAGCF